MAINLSSHNPDKTSNGIRQPGIRQISYFFFLLNLEKYFGYENILITSKS